MVEAMVNMDVAVVKVKDEEDFKVIKISHKINNKTIIIMEDMLAIGGAIEAEEEAKHKAGN